jgi:hypothetical protein
MAIMKIKNINEDIALHIALKKIATTMPNLIVPAMPNWLRIFAVITSAANAIIGEKSIYPIVKKGIFLKRFRYGSHSLAKTPFSLCCLDENHDIASLIIIISI